MERVEKFIKSLNITSKVVVACSGGPDSMYLLYLLNSLGLDVVCAHVNHKMREESDDEYLFLEDYCKKNNIVFEGVELTGYEKGNFENYAREFRYDFFEKVLNKYNTDLLFTAHHGDDLMETILMRLVRGSSLKGYQGFTKITNKKDYRIIRPLVYLTKEQIEYMLEEKNIPYVIDKSNFEDDYTRNRFRHHVLPFLKEEDSLVHEKFLKYSEIIEDTDKYIDRVVNGYLDRILSNNVLNIENFDEIDEYIQNKIIFNILELLYPDNLYLVNNNHIVEILKLIKSDKPNLSMVLPNNIIVKKEYNSLFFDHKPINEIDYCYELDERVETEDFIIEKVDSIDSNSNYVIRLNSKNLTLPLSIRNKKDNDKISVKNMNGSKKINDIFIDMKVPKEKRFSWPLLVDANNEILWVPGLKKSKFDVSIGDECDIILTYRKKERNYEEQE